MSEKEQQDQQIKALIAKNATYLGIKNNEDMAKRIGVSRTTMYKKLEHPETFTVKEIRRLAKILNFKIVLQDGIPVNCKMAGE